MEAVPQGKYEEDFLHGVNVASSHVAVRMGFLRKVYGILSMQLLMTTAVAALFMAVEPIKAFVQQNNWMLMVSFFAAMALIFATHVKRHSHPTNLYLLAAFTLTQAYTVGTLVTFYEVPAVLEAFGLTAAVCVAVTMYAMQTKRDFTVFYGILITSLWVLILAGFLQAFFPPDDPMQRVFAVGGALLFSIFIIADTQMMLYRLSADEHIIAAINLYMDIINLFIHILKALDRK